MLQEHSRLGTILGVVGNAEVNEAVQILPGDASKSFRLDPLSRVRRQTFEDTKVRGSLDLMTKIEGISISQRMTDLRNFSEDLCNTMAL